jgi:putative membrane protein
MLRRTVALTSALMLGAALCACSPSSRDKAKEDAAKAEAAAKSAASEAKTAATNAATAVETAAADHGIGVKSTPDFIRDAAISDMFEIRSSRLALKRSKDPAVKAFAHHMIADHTKLSSQMKALVGKEGLAADLPTDLDSDHQGKLTDLQNASDADFDHKYLDDQRSGHEAAVGMFKAYADGGSDAGLKAAAAGALPVIQGHLDEVKALQKSQDKTNSSGQ